jgi:hypothetical protein
MGRVVHFEIPADNLLRFACPERPETLRFAQSDRSEGLAVTRGGVKILSLHRKGQNDSLQ